MLHHRKKVCKLFGFSANNIASLTVISIHVLNHHPLHPLQIFHSSIKQLRDIINLVLMFCSRMYLLNSPFIFMHGLVSIYSSLTAFSDQLFTPNMNLSIFLFIFLLFLLFIYFAFFSLKGKKSLIGVPFDWHKATLGFPNFAHCQNVEIFWGILNKFNIFGFSFSTCPICIRSGKALFQVQSSYRFKQFIKLLSLKNQCHISTFPQLKNLYLQPYHLKTQNILLFVFLWNINIYSIHFNFRFQYISIIPMQISKKNFLQHLFTNISSETI